MQDIAALVASSRMFDTLSLVVVVGLDFPFRLVAAGIVLLLDFAWCFRTECEWIWKRQLNMIRLVYIFSRTFPALALIANLVLLIRFLPPFDLKVCQNWFLFLHLSSASVQVALTTILYLRACALHQNVSAVRIWGIFAVSVDTVVVFGGGILLYFVATFDAQCTAKPKRLGFALPVVFLANQSIAWFLTWYGEFLLSRRLHPFGGAERRQMIPFIPTLLRDSGIVVTVAILGALVAVPYTATAGIQTHFVYSWTMTGLSCFVCTFSPFESVYEPLTQASAQCCHLILNLYSAERVPPHFEISHPNLETISVHLEPAHNFPSPVYLRPTKDIIMKTEEYSLSGPSTISSLTIAKGTII
ncbi:hypothetical protein AGABI1DRAFT_131788 [Agaricus bisporus var. burnettii JB137-S8]|uniref:DUF6533 domain-containing protein n=1 Tax=Agaricus bisporus var. burnettii (strain JB137-S8 / ATCC MYA-4627 / FGSC 10392) TaxID=597362 RepID=K5WKQ0_AGABU|nr:uncharacterized protein AGABI1DRAFT_131788 [Agaricus bisporus var. burnettii JB137-S8]EKM75881.1 hypothetical protein AGABI1DRAFT_131788 [Agaricus bisporus var. burnettii JB137-S8]